MSVPTDENSEEVDDDRSGDEPIVPEGVIEGIEDARNGDFATKESLHEALFSDE